MSEKVKKNELNIYQRVNGVMKDVEYIQKSEKKVNGQYTFVSHDQVAAVIHPALVNHGIVVVPNVAKCGQVGNRTEVHLEVEFINMDNPSDKFLIVSVGYGIDQSDKGPGKAVSYAYKYALLKTFCLETGDDPDCDAKSTFVGDEKEEAESYKCISADQVRILGKLLARRADLVSRILTAHKINSLDELREELFHPVLTKIKEIIDQEKNTKEEK